MWANSPLVRIESFRVLDTFPIGILSSIERWRQLLEQDTQQLMFGKCCCIRITLWTILTRQIYQLRYLVTIFADVCRLFMIIRCESWLSGVRSTLSVSLASRPPRCCGLNFQSSDANMVNFHIEYVDNLKTSV